MKISWIAFTITVGLSILLGCKQDNSACDLDEGYEYVQKLVRSQLVSPSSAIFPKLNEDGVLFSFSVEECSFRFDAYVDSQNSFGAMIRTKYFGRVLYNKLRKEWGKETLTLMR